MKHITWWLLYFWWNSMCSCLSKTAWIFCLWSPTSGGRQQFAGFSKKGPQVSNPRHLANRSPHGSPTRQTRNDAVTLTADARDERCEVWVQVWPCVDPSVKLSCARLFHRFSKIHCLLEKRKHQLTKQKADYKTMSGTEWNRNRICSQLFLLHARIFWWLSKSRMRFIPLELISVVGCLETNSY